MWSPSKAKLARLADSKSLTGPGTRPGQRGECVSFGSPLNTLCPQ